MDPATPVIGFVTGTISFLVSNVPQILDIRERSKVEESKRLLKNLELDFIKCLSDYQSWVERWWDGRPYYHEQYPYLWGEQGWKVLRARRRKIFVLALKILEILESFRASRRARIVLRRSTLMASGRSKFGDDEIKEFLGAVDTNQEKINAPYRRIWFAVYRHATLKIHVDDLLAATSALLQESNTYFCRAGLHDDDQPPHRELIKHTKTLIKLSRLSSMLYSIAEASSADSEWTLHMSPPNELPTESESGFHDLVAEKSICFTVKRRSSSMIHVKKTLTFRIVNEPELQNTSGEVAISDLEHLREVIPQSLLNRNFPMMLWFEGTLYSVTEDASIARSSGSFHLERPRLRGREHPLNANDSTDACLAVILWFMVMCEADWFHHLCQHRVKYIKNFDDDNTNRCSPGHYPKHLLRLWSPSDAEPHGEYHLDRQSDVEQLPKLGVFIGELLTGCSFSQCIPNITISQQREMVETLHNFVHKDVAIAVHWCLNNGGGSDRNNSSPYAMPPRISKEVLARYVLCALFVLIVVNADLIVCSNTRSGLTKATNNIENAREPQVLALYSQPINNIVLFELALRLEAS